MVKEDGSLTELITTENFVTSASCVIEKKLHER